MEEFSGALRQATRAINAREGRDLEGPRVLLSGKQDVPTATLPNPGYRMVAAAVEPGRQELAPTLEHLDYWLEKASGRTSATDAGWYFSGRRPLNEELASFLRGPAAVMVVTGIAASGKSAILGRAVTLSDESFRRSDRFEAAVLHCPPETVPDEGSVTVAVTAHNRDPLDLLRAIAMKVGATADPSGGTDALRRWQAGLSRFLQPPDRWSRWSSTRWTRRTIPWDACGTSWYPWPATGRPTRAWTTCRHSPRRPHPKGAVSAS
ncbi:hypothetical protein ACIPY6_40175 [Streptomyces sp. NPDC090054]|uniref:hypothetical protein n=1 Tax=Streptomyces sp. NPDC090054 TaxID=3365933 RepID=UPI0038016F09